MFSKIKWEFVFGILSALAIYCILSVVALIAFSSTTGSDMLPVKQEVKNVRTFRTNTGILIEFESHTHSPMTQVIHFIRALRNQKTDKTILLPPLDFVVTRGEMTLNIIANVPSLESGIWEYQRALTHRPDWSINDKISLYPPIQFKVCDEIGRECRI